MIDGSVCEFISFKYCLLYLLVHNCGPKLLISGYKNQHSEIYDLDMSESESALPHPSLPCILFSSQDFSHKIVCLWMKLDDDILLVASFNNSCQF